MSLDLKKLADWWAKANCFEPPFDYPIGWKRDEIKGAWRVLDAIVPRKLQKEAWRNRIKRKNKSSAYESNDAGEKSINKLVNKTEPEAR